MDLVTMGQDFLYLVGDDGIEAAAEGIQFYQFQVGMLFDILSCPVEAGMIGPLVYDAQVSRELAQRSYAVFGQDGEAQAVDEFGDAVIDFRIDVIGTAAEDDSPFAFLASMSSVALVMA